jgi:hypothetical protein
MVVTIILDIDGVSHVCRTFENESIQINKLVASIDNLGSQGTITRQSFRLPLIGGLLEAIGDVTDPSQSAKVNLNKSIKGRILVDGFERFFGSFFVVNTTKGDSKEVEMIFQGNETDLKATLSNITMAELCDGETLGYNFTTLSAYFTNPHQYQKDNGYLFPVIDYGDKFTYDTSASVGVVVDLFETNFKPAITLQKLFELMPINITVNNMEQIMHQSILLHNSKERIPTTNTSQFNNTGYIERTTDLSASTPFTNYIIPLDGKTVYNSANASIFDISDQADCKYIIPQREYNGYSFRVDGDIDFTILSSSNNVALKLLINGVEKGVFVAISVANGITSFSGQINYPFLLEPSDEIQLVFTTGNITSVVFKAGFRFSVTRAPSLTSSSLINISANCPELTAWDIFRTVAIQSNAQIISNPDGTYEMTPFNDWIEDNAEVIILDDVIEDGVDVQIKPFSVQGAKSIRLAYKENDDFYSKQYKELTNENFGEKFIENTGTELAKNELKIEVPISTIPSVPVDSSPAVIPKMVDGSLNVIVGKPTLLQSNYDDDGTSTDNESYTTFPFTLKSLFSTDSLFFPSIQFIGNWRQQSGGFTQTDNNFGQSLSYWSNIGYPSQNLYERYWKTYLEETYSEQSREIKMNIKLNRNQIDGLDFNEKFYYKNTLLRLVKLEGISLTSNQPATATFMKRFTIFPTDIATYYPYDVINSIVQWKVSADNSSVGDGSGETPSVEASANAYGFFYDSNQDIATQSGQILIT